MAGEAADKIFVVVEWNVCGPTVEGTLWVKIGQELPMLARCSPNLDSDSQAYRIVGPITINACLAARDQLVRVIEMLGHEVMSADISDD